MIKKSLKKNDKLIKEWLITVPANDLEEQIKVELINEIQPKAKVQGFRQGHTPIDILDKHYGERAMYNVLNKVIQENIQQIYKEEDYSIAISPDVSFKSQPVRKKEVCVSITFTLKPIIPEIKYSKFSFSVSECELSADEKKEEMNRFLKRFGKDVLVGDENHKVENGDVVEIDFIGKIDGVPFEGGAAKGYKLEIGSKSFIDNFEDQILSHKKGDSFDVSVKFPDGYHAKDLSGKPAVFSINLNNIYRKELPELNDEFAKTMNFESVAKMEEMILNNAVNSLNKQAKNLIKKQVLDAIIEKYDFEIPETIVEREIVERMNNEKKKLADHVHDENCKHDKHSDFNEKAFRKENTTQIEKSYRAFYFIDSVAKEQKIEVSKEEVQQVAIQEAIRSGADFKEIMNRIEKDEGLLNYISFSLKEDRVFEYVYGQINKDVKKLSMKKMQEFLMQQSSK
jgi:trigger factor